MDILVFLIPAAILIAIGFVSMFIWATKKGQYDDLETPAHKILIDDEPIKNIVIKKKRNEHE